MLKSLNSGGSLPVQFRSLQLKLIDQSLQFGSPGACDAFGSNRRFRPRLGSALLICKHLGPGKKLLLFECKVLAHVGELSTDRITRMF